MQLLIQLIPENVTICVPEHSFLWALLCHSIGPFFRRFPLFYMDVEPYKVLNNENIFCQIKSHFQDLHSPSFVLFWIADDTLNQRREITLILAIHSPESLY